jgi:hypothetical protein
VRTMPETEPAQPSRLAVDVHLALDVIILAVLGGVAWAARSGSLPSDGLWFDDSWVAAGAVLGSPRELLVVGSSHPGFTAILMAIDRLAGGDLTYLGVPSLVFGVVAPVALYLGLRWLGYARAISGVVSAALVVAPIPILYSGRVKGYTLDMLVVLLIAMAIPWLARRTWHWPLAAAWIVAAVGVGTFSGYALVASAGAGLILVLHPAGDRAMRITAVGIQAVIQGVYFVVLQSKSDQASIEKVMEVAFDGHMTFSWNPLTFGRELLTHLRRLAEVFPGSPGSNSWWLALLALLAMTGLVIAAAKGRRPETLTARYLLLLVVVAAGGSLVDRFPFGPSNEVPFSAGGRHTLWLVPALAFGFAALAHRARGWAARRDPLRLGFDALAVAAAIAIVALGYGPAPEAPFPGSESGARFVDGSIRSGDVVIVTGSSTFSYAISTTTPVGVEETPDHEVGFAPVYLDPRIKNVGGWAVAPGSPAEMLAWTADAGRVFVLSDGPLGGPGREQARAVLEPAGFTLLEARAFGWSVVDIYRH